MLQVLQLSVYNYVITIRNSMRLVAERAKYKTFTQETGFDSCVVLRPFISCSFLSPLHLC